MDKEGGGKLSTSKGICVTDQFPDAIFYVAHPICSCGECSQVISLQFNEDFQLLELEVEATFEHYDLFGYDWKSKSKSQLLYKIWHRIRVAFGMLVHGKISLRHYFMFKNEAIEDYIKALQEGYEKVKQFKKTQEEKENERQT